MEVLVTTTGAWRCRKITGFLMTGKKRLKNDSFGTRRGWILILSRIAEGYMHLVSEVATQKGDPKGPDNTDSDLYYRLSKDKVASIVFVQLAIFWIRRYVSFLKRKSD